MDSVAHYCKVIYPGQWSKLATMEHFNCIWVNECLNFTSITAIRRYFMTVFVARYRYLSMTYLLRLKFSTLVHIDYTTYHPYCAHEYTMLAFLFRSHTRRII